MDECFLFCFDFERLFQFGQKIRREFFRLMVETFHQDFQRLFVRMKIFGQRKNDVRSTVEDLHDQTIEFLGERRAVLLEFLLDPSFQFDVEFSAEGVKKFLQSIEFVLVGVTLN